MAVVNADGEAPRPTDAALARIQELEAENGALVNLLCAMTIKHGVDAVAELSPTDLLEVDGKELRTKQTELAIVLTVVSVP